MQKETLLNCGCKVSGSKTNIEVIEMCSRHSERITDKLVFNISGEIVRFLTMQLELEFTIKVRKR